MVVGHGLCRLVHAFTSAEVLPSQYKRMSMFAEMGVVVIVHTETKNVAKTLAKVVKGKRGNPVKDQLCDNCNLTHVHMHTHLCVGRG